MSGSLRIRRVPNATWNINCRSLCDVTPNCEAWVRRATGTCRLLKGHSHLLTATHSEANYDIGKKDCGSCSRVVLDFNSRDGIQQEVVNKVLNEDVEVTDKNYWLSPSELKGEDSFLVIDLGCIKEISGVYLRNTHNGNQNNRGTKSFSLKFRVGLSDPWEKIETTINSLERFYSSGLKKTKWVPFSVNLSLRYLKFIVDDFYGNGGGLSYIGVHEADAGGEASSYPGN